MAEPIVFKFSALVLAIPFGVAIGALGAAVLFFYFGRKINGGIAIVVALIAGLVFGPSMVSDRVVITEEKIEQTTGFVWSPTVKGFRFEEVEYVRITEKPTGSKGRMSMIWEVHGTNGTRSDLDPGDLWEHNTHEIVPILRERGVVFR